MSIQFATEVEFTCDINELTTLGAVNRGDCACERDHNKYDGHKGIFTELRLKPFWREVGEKLMMLNANYF